MSILFAVIIFDIPISLIISICSSLSLFLFQVCTYENWPKSLKCSMCGCLKDGSVNNETDRFGANTISSPERDIDENCAGNFIISNANKRNLSHHRYQLSSNEPINNCDSLQERRLRQIRRQADWQWLNACIGEWCTANFFFSIFQFSHHLRLVSLLLSLSLLR